MPPFCPRDGEISQTAPMTYDGQTTIDWNKRNTHFNVLNMDDVSCWRKLIDKKSKLYVHECIYESQSIDAVEHWYF